MKEEVSKYLNRAELHLKDARLLLAANSINGAINRAYYAMFAAIQAALFPHGKPTKSHSGAHSKFREIYIKTNLLPSELNKLLSTVFELREEADYDDEIFTETEMGEKALQSAEIFVNSIKEYFQDKN